MNVHIKNLTCHPIRIVRIDSETKEQTLVKVFETEKDLPIPRVSTNEYRIGFIKDHDDEFYNVYSSVPGEVEDLPEKVEGVFLIVSRMVAEASMTRDDLLIPYSLVRDDQGQVIGCEGFSTCFQSDKRLLISLS